MLRKENLCLMNSTLLKIQWQGLRFTEKFNHSQGIRRLIELGIDAGLQVNQEGFIEILAYAEIN